MKVDIILNFVSFNSSPQGDCLRRYDGYETTPMDRNFSTPKAGTMADLCKAGFGPTATLVVRLEFFHS